MFGGADVGRVPEKRGGVCWVVGPSVAADLHGVGRTSAGGAVVVQDCLTMNEEDFSTLRLDRDLVEPH